MKSSLRVAVGVALGLVTAVPLFAQTDHMGGSAPSVKWGAAPPFFPSGARFAVIQGDPSQAGPYTVRLEFPAGYVIKPHFHPTDENVTVLSGRFLVGMGDSVVTTGAMVLGPEGFVTAPASAHHFAVAQRKTVIQVHGIGPFAITYVNPADDPRGQASSR